MLRSLSVSVHFSWAFSLGVFFAGLPRHGCRHQRWKPSQKPRSYLMAWHANIYNQSLVRYRSSAKKQLASCTVTGRRQDAPVSARLARSKRYGHPPAQPPTRKRCQTRKRSGLHNTKSSADGRATCAPSTRGKGKNSWAQPPGVMQYPVVGTLEHPSEQPCPGRGQRNLSPAPRVKPPIGPGCGGCNLVC
jgi:hypothetical protein